ncbi:MAG TPA: nitrilase-related carbon-nitrogen hydrolase, partial [Gemmatimonadaceae bacterium]|nr:nitrilase-related carbon-nitrogen hydrolase [Gemmatimonadaceae bacterium]
MTRSVHLAIAQFHPRKGDYAGNLARLGPLFAQVDAQHPRPEVLCLPESALTGYFLEGGVAEHAVTAGALAADLQAAYRAAVPGDSTLDVVIGFYERWSGKLYNSGMYVTLGGAEPVVRHVHRKMFLPTYGLFDEERFVERGREIRAFDTPWGRAAILICEDAWHSLTATVAALDGAQVLFVPTAPPARGPWRDADQPGLPSSVSRWERLARDMADEHGVFVVLANLAGSEGGRVFPGAAMVAGPKGEVRTRGPLWTEALIVDTLDFDDVARARADQPLLADLEVMAPHLRAAMER